MKGVLLLFLLSSLGYASNVTAVLHIGSPVEPSQGTKVIIRANDICFIITQSSGHPFVGMSEYQVCWKDFYTSYVDLVETVAALRQRVRALEQKNGRPRAWGTV